MFLVTSLAPIAKQRRPYRVPAGFPKARENWRLGTVVSLLIHVGVLVLIITPFAASDDLRRMALGAGGPGPAGGGGGGNRGSGGTPERIEFVRVAPAPAPPQPKVETPQPVPEPVIVEPPKPVIQQLPQVQAPQIPMASVATIGTGGAGSDNTGGQGPGSGGGVGTGVGTGRGSGVGPGTGGGSQENYPPTAIELAIPPLPVPKSLQGDSVIAEFDVDVTGRVLSVKFSDTGDRGYNRKLEDILRTVRFRPGTTPDGRPIRMKTQIVYQF